MVLDLRPQFPYRHNCNGSHEAICAVCHVRVASMEVEAELKRPEATQVCDPDRLFELKQKSNWTD